MVVMLLFEILYFMLVMGVYFMEILGVGEGFLFLMLVILIWMVVLFLVVME